MRIFFYVLIILIGFVACKSDSGSSKQESDVVEKTPQKELKVPPFNADSAYQYVQDQVSFGSRVPNSEAHEKAKEYLKNQLERMTDQIVVQEFSASRYDGVRMKGYNIIGSFNPKAKKRLLLLAHWDSRFMADYATSEEFKSEPVTGADDGGSGVGVLLEIARQLSLQPVDVGVDILLTDLEDQGKSNDPDGTTWALGAQHWSKNPHVKNYRAEYGILLDMVGAKGAQFLKEGVSRSYAPQFLNYVWNLANSMGYGHLFVNKNLRGGVVDDHVFINQNMGIPTIDIINKPSDNSFGDHWHTENDNMEIIDKNVLRGVGQVVTAVVYRFDANYL
ncbi:M28 family peptidase [Membranicola marinus]|uniref:M28 family peptidase n=1 Tax=Membranihabitans marinus TaxID=1227546 RepID=A0A953HWQ6_9BACT|nr:M28 family peptidase [Membranihabitans marinus]MBY5957167.1 M28 family peptidase [Membranihabitans marinus]